MPETLAPASKEAVIVKKTATAETLAPQFSNAAAPKPAIPNQSTTVKPQSSPVTTPPVSKPTGANKHSTPGARKTVSSWVSRGISSAAQRWIGNDNDYDYDYDAHNHDSGSDSDDDFYDFGDVDDRASKNGRDSFDKDNANPVHTKHTASDRDNHNGHTSNVGGVSTHNAIKFVSKEVDGMIKAGQNSRPSHRSAQVNTSATTFPANDAISPPEPASHIYPAPHQDYDIEKSAHGQKARATKISTVEVDEKKASDDGQSAQQQQPPRPSRRCLGLGFFEIFLKIVNILSPLFFIALGVLHIEQVGQLQFDPFAKAVTEVRTVAVTMWPIMFAAIATQSLKAYGTFQAERGIKLMTLEQLLHSTSFSSAVKQPMLLRRLDWMSVVLFVVWAVSPLASQALQRMAYLGPVDTPFMSDVIYFRANGADLVNESSDAVDIEERNSFFSAAMLSSSSTIESPRDTWGNPKIPMISQSSLDADGTGWYDVVPGASVVWTSLVGTPASMPDPLDIFNSSNGDNFTAHYTFDTGYFDFKCADLQDMTASNVNISLYQRSIRNKVFLTVDVVPPQGRSGANNGTLQWAFSLYNSTTPQVVDSYRMTSCNFSLVQTSNWVECISGSAGWSCQVTRVQPKTTSDVDIANAYFLTDQLFAGYFPNALSSNPNATWSLLEEWLSTLGSGSGLYDGSGLGDAPFPKPNGNFSSRLSQLVNTYFWAAGDKEAITDEGDAYIQTNTNLFSTEATFVDKTIIWLISTVWISVFYICIAVTLLFAIADIFWEARTVSPNFLGFASNVVRNNQALRKEFQGRKLSGYERARAMADLTIILQDMKPESDVGKIALAPAHPGLARLQRDRTYL